MAAATMPARSGSGSGYRRGPSTSRRWLQPRISSRQLYRLAPKPRKKPQKLGAADYWDHARYGLRSWGIWLVLAFGFALAGREYWAIGSGVAAFLFYLTKPVFHAAV